MTLWCCYFTLLFCPMRFRERLGVKVVKALKRSNNGVIHAAVDMLCALMCVSTGVFLKEADSK